MTNSTVLVGSHAWAENGSAKAAASASLLNERFMTPPVCVPFAAAHHSSVGLPASFSFSPQSASLDHGQDSGRWVAASVATPLRLASNVPAAITMTAPA